mmetsp:Transcript_104190/g.336023  ORF Transcript_104190/g.336023 Transcript_104190/m.336023 type:complete len:239 (+) Transcript_104190:1025-1741(+)
MPQPATWWAGRSGLLHLRSAQSEPEAVGITMSPCAMVTQIRRSKRARAATGGPSGSARATRQGGLSPLGRSCTASCGSCGEMKAVSRERFRHIASGAPQPACTPRCGVESVTKVPATSSGSPSNTRGKAARSTRPPREWPMQWRVTGSGLSEASSRAACRISSAAIAVSSSRPLPTTGLVWARRRRSGLRAQPGRSARRHSSHAVQSSAEPPMPCASTQRARPPGGSAAAILRNPARR